MQITSNPAGFRTAPLRERPAPIPGLCPGPGIMVRGWLVRGPFVAGLVFLALCCALSSPAEVNPYTDVIVTRNVFGLKEPPPPPAPPDTTPPVPKLTLVGIANVFGTKKAVIKAQPAPGTPPKAAVPGGPPPGQEPPLVLVEGAMQDGITVVSIDEATGTVRVDNHGQALTLSFAKDGLKAPSGPAAPVPGPTGLPGQPAIPRPPGMPGAPITVGLPVPGQPAMPAGMTEEMRQKFAQRYGLAVPGQLPPPFPHAVPGAVAR